MNNGQAGDRRPTQMHDVSHLNLKCAECGTPIDKLPFQPTPGRDVFCRDCNRNRRKNFN